MVTIVVLINTFISLVLLYVAWRIWQLRLRLAKIAKALSTYERCTHAVLQMAPQTIYTRQQKIQHLRMGNQVLQLQIQQIRQIFSLLFLGQQLWQRTGRKLGLKFVKKTIAK
jgi:predicted negative regulator of RcsB-dependent stress response